MPKNLKKLITALPAIWLIAAVSLHGQDLLPAKLQAALLFKTLGYVTSPDQICVNGTIYVGILFDDKIATQAYSKDVLGEILTLKSTNYKVYNADIEPILLKYDKEEALSENLAKRKIRVLYVITQNKDYLKTILKLTKQLKILSVTGINPDEHVKFGISIGFGVHDGKPAIITNTKSIKNEEKEFKKDFYSLVTTVE
jgi:hypothetical protein